MSIWVDSNTARIHYVFASGVVKLDVVGRVVLRIDTPGSKRKFQVGITVALQFDMNGLLENLSDTALVDESLDDGRARIIINETLHTRAR